MRLKGAALCIAGGLLLQQAVPAHAALTLVTLGPAYQVGLGDYTDIDVNADGINDIRFGTPGTFGSNFSTYVTPLNGTEVMFDPYFDTVTKMDNWIGDGDTFIIDDTPRLIPGGPGAEYRATVYFRWLTGNFNASLAYGNALGGAGGPFINQNSGYLGFSFTAVDGRHYGWFDIGSVFTNSVLLNAYAYETTPNAPVYLYGYGAPEPTRTMLLLLGIISILHRRRRALGSG